MVKACQHDALADGCERLEALHAIIHTCTVSMALRLACDGQFVGIKLLTAAMYALRLDSRCK